VGTRVEEEFEMASTETEAGVQINPDELANSVVDQDASEVLRNVLGGSHQISCSSMLVSTPSV